MNKYSSMNRRAFVKYSGLTLASIPIFVTNTVAQELPILTEDDPTGMALAYIADTTLVDTDKYPNHQVTQLCSNCAMYTGDIDSDTGPCAIFPGKSVAANGWCSVWVEKPA